MLSQIRLSRERSTTRQCVLAYSGDLDVLETFAQRRLLKLAGGGAGNRVDEFERVRQPELREVRRQEGAQIVRRRGRAWLEHDRGERTLAPFLRHDRNDRGLRDGWMSHQR